jgi:glycosyltransferase involved in cell wall biosynthesis/predicted SAM-dependent methyltransferase
MEFSSDLLSPQNLERHAYRPFFSIILPVYNACRTNSRYLIEALESIRQQTYRDFELIIVNDGSTDDTEAVCQDFISRNPDLNISYHVKENQGQSSARNFGARASRGAYLCFIDQDDIWIENKLKIIRPYLDSDLDLIYTDGDIIDESGSVQVVGIHRNYQYGSPHPKRSINDILFKDIYVMPGLMAIKKETFLRVNGFDEALSGYEDDDLFLRIYETGKTKYLPVSTLKWRMYESAYGLSHRMIRSRLLYWDKLLKGYTNDGKDKHRARRITGRFLRECLFQSIIHYGKKDDLCLENLHGAKRISSSLPFLEWISFQSYFLSDYKRTMEKIKKFYEQKEKDNPDKWEFRTISDKIKDQLKKSLYRFKDLIHNNSPAWLKGLYLDLTGITILRNRVEELSNQRAPSPLDRETLAEIYLKGNGIEIGALDAPLTVPDSAKVRYIDRMFLQQLLAHYPHCSELNLVKIDIIGDGEKLEFIKDSSQDFVIANHFIEHCQNPIAAVWNMLRILKSGGILYLAIPDKNETFDVDRQVTPIEHLLRDYNEGPTWSKQEHYEEYVTVVDKLQEKIAAEKQTAQLMKDDYRIHYHVWTQMEMLEFFVALKKTLNFPFAIELSCKNGWKMIFILKKIP